MTSFSVAPLYERRKTPVADRRYSSGRHCILQSSLEADHVVCTVLELGWGGLPDPILVERLRGRCEVFLTIDQGFEHEHNLASLGFGIVIVHIRRNRIAHYQAIREEISQAVSAIGPGEVIHVGSGGSASVVR